MPFNISKGRLKDVDQANFEGLPTSPRQKGLQRPLADRQRNFKEVEFTLNESQAQVEAARCLSCGCLDAFNCRLRTFAARYRVDIDRLPIWTQRRHPLKEDHPFIAIDPNKCITCRICVHGCSDYQLQDAFELNELPAFSEGSPPVFSPAINDRCVNCGLCVAYCPTGALEEKKAPDHPGPGDWNGSRPPAPIAESGLSVVSEKRVKTCKLLRSRGWTGPRPTTATFASKAGSALTLSSTRIV